MIRRLALACIVLAACGGKAAFRLSSDENNAYALDRDARAPPLPEHADAGEQQRPAARVRARGRHPEDDRRVRPRGRQRCCGRPTPTSSRGSRSAVTSSSSSRAEQLVARDQRTRHVALEGRHRRRRSSVPPRIASARTSSPRTATPGGSPRTTAAVAVELWKHDASGQLGAPAAHGGVVYVAVPESVAVDRRRQDRRTPDAVARRRRADLDRCA